MSIELLPPLAQIDHVELSHLHCLNISPRAHARCEFELVHVLKGLVFVPIIDFSKAKIYPTKSES